MFRNEWLVLSWFFAFTGVLSAGQQVFAQNDIKPYSVYNDLFNGKDLDGWHQRPNVDPRKYAESLKEIEGKSEKEAKPNWRAEQGELVHKDSGLYLTTDKEYRDYELLLKYKAVDQAETSVYFGGSPLVQISNDSVVPQAADAEDPKTDHPKEDENDESLQSDRPLGEWNSLRVIRIGGRISVWLNDKAIFRNVRAKNTWDQKLPLFCKGSVQLFSQGGEVRWKDIQIREMECKEANAFLAGDNAGFQPLFDGKALRRSGKLDDREECFKGWKGELKNYMIVDGTIECRRGAGGTIYFGKEYADFVARVQFQLSPAANSGLAIRYPGSGNTAYIGMAELQVLDSPHPYYKSLDNRQRHGSAYGMVAATPGYLRPVGEWNFQEVTVKGSTIRVELNGSVILDTDLSKVDEYLGGTPHPGKVRTQGYFGISGHSDPVRYRDIRVREIKPAITEAR